jgi:hypothetical protein
MGQFISVKEASQILGVTGHTLRAFLRELKEKEPDTYSTHILTYTHKFNKSLVIYTLNEDFVKDLKKRFSTYLHTHLHTYFDSPEQTAEQKRETPEKDTGSHEVFRGVIDTLQVEISAQRETLNRLLQDHAKERERADLIIMQLRGDVKQLNDKIMLLTEGGKEQAEPPDLTTKQVKTEQPGPEAVATKQAARAEEYRFTVGDRFYFLKQDIKRILNKKIF